MAIEFPAPAAFLKFLTRGRVGDDVHARYAVMSACIFQMIMQESGWYHGLFPSLLSGTGFFMRRPAQMKYAANLLVHKKGAQQ